MYYWKINDGRIWSAEAAAFVDAVPEGEIVAPLYSDGTPAGIDYLRRTILFYGYELGELMTLEEARSAKLAEVMGKYKAAFAEIEIVYPSEEREGWPIQKEEALALRNNPQAETPALSMLVSRRGKGETVSELAEKVLQNAAHWPLVYAYITGQQQRRYAEVSALGTVADIQAYEVAYQVPK